MARLRSKPRQRINRNHTEVIQHPTYKIGGRKRLARGKPLCWGELVDFYDGGDHVRPFSQTPKYVDQTFQRPQIC